jgi:trehalose-phosphatase
MKHLIIHWDTVAVRIRKAEHILLLCDYDGTLTPIVERPELADLMPAMRLCLQQLAKIPRVSLGVVSGRAMEDLQDRVAIDNIIYVGNHGLEIQGHGISFIHPIAKKAETCLYSLDEELSKALAHIEGARVDNKGLTLSLHYRLVDEAQLEEVDKIFYHVINPFVTSGKVKVMPSKKAYDIRPAVDWGKGKAVELLAEKLGEKSKLLVVFLGDDITDFDGFRAVNERGGISVFIAEENMEAEAQYFLRSPQEVYQFLGMIKETLS